MKTSMALTGTAILALGAAGIATAQTTVTPFQPQPCVLTLSPQYTADALGWVASEIPASALACPAGFDLGTDGFTSGTLTNGSSQSGPRVEATTLQYFDPASNSIMQRKVLQLVGSVSSGQIPVTYDSFLATTSVPYVTRGGLYYRVVLAAPVSISSSAPVSPSCQVTLEPKYTWRWNQANYWVIPDSAVKCTGITFSSNTTSLFMPLQSRQLNQGYLATASSRSYNQDTGQFTLKRELRLMNYALSSYDQLVQFELGFYGFYGVAAREDQTAGGASGSLPGNPVWGRFSLQQQADFLPPIIIQQAYFPPADAVAASGLYPRLRVTGPVTIKRATDVTLKSRRLSGGRLRLSITADRNASFQNTTAPTYRRQTVLPGSRADQAVLRRGSKVLKRVKLSPYGTASVTIRDIRGRNRYSVTLVATNNNYQGVATIRA